MFLDEPVLRATLSNLKFTAPVQVGMELAKVLFTAIELATSSLTGQKVNGQTRQPLDPARLCLVDNLVQNKIRMNQVVNCQKWDKRIACKSLQVPKIEVGPTKHVCHLGRCSLLGP